MGLVSVALMGWVLELLVREGRPLVERAAAAARARIEYHLAAPVGRVAIRSEQDGMWVLQSKYEEAHRRWDVANPRYREYVLSLSHSENGDTAAKNWLDLSPGVRRRLMDLC